MIRRKTLLSLAVLFALATVVSAAESSQVAALHNEIKLLKTQRDVSIKAVKAQYDAMIKRDKVEEHVLIKEREALHAQERELLAVATTESEKEAIRLQYDTLRAVLKVDTKIDAALINRLRLMEKETLAAIHAAYDSKIKFLENEIKTLNSAPKPKKK